MSELFEKMAKELIAENGRDHRSPQGGRCT